MCVSAYMYVCVYVYVYLYVLRMYIRIYMNVYIDKKKGSEPKPADTQPKYQSLQGKVAVRKSFRF